MSFRASEGFSSPENPQHLRAEPVFELKTDNYGIIYPHHVPIDFQKSIISRYITGFRDERTSINRFVLYSTPDVACS